ncbi:hypothetical protein THAOC_18419 [Thalassiosira oceanica]|uniref:Uncharacterized protein n=1 Tax=Thalassiosira oceanica TaxID=159749 RepID=K0SS69_THAOC|nr:hypothetical protein THAOC_18419 [Thalassiosira oceanica]|eukprot:EJK61137.1 hypothetical protein THAOC_18419 [Thalassiosira oceanica]
MKFDPSHMTVCDRCLIGADGFSRQGDANCSTTPSLHRTAVGNIERRLIDEFTPAAASSDLQIRTRTGEANRQRCRRGAAEEPSTDIGPEGGVDGPRWTRGAVALQGLSSIPHLTSVATGFYRSDVINGSGTSAGAMGAVVGPPGEAMEELDSPYRRCAGRADRARQGAVVAIQYRRENKPKGESRIGS